MPIRPNLAPSGSYNHIGGTLASSSPALASLPPGTTIISSGQNVQGMQGYALVPAQFVPQLQQQYASAQPPLKPAPMPRVSHSSNLVAYNFPAIVCMLALFRFAEFIVSTRKQQLFEKQQCFESNHSNDTVSPPIHILHLIFILHSTSHLQFTYDFSPIRNSVSLHSFMFLLFQG